jgi:hypothetical protein
MNNSYSATVASLEAKVGALTTTNTLMKEDLAVHKRSLAREMEESRRLTLQLGSTKLLVTPYSPATDVAASLMSPTTTVASTSDSESSSGASSSRYPIDSTMRDKLAEAICAKDRGQRDLKLQVIIFALCHLSTPKQTLYFFR